MTWAGRPAAKRPPTIYQYRRMLFLIQLAARQNTQDGFEDELRYMRKEWQLESASDSLFDMLQALSRHAIEQGRENWIKDNEPLSSSQ